MPEHIRGRTFNCHILRAGPDDGRRRFFMEQVARVILLKFVLG